MTETILSTTAFDFEGLPRYPPRWNWCVASLCDRAASSEISVPLCRQLSEVSPSIRTYASGRDQDAFAALCQHAVEQGANAVIGVRYDATEVMQRGHGDAVLWDSGADRKSDVRGNGPAQVRCLSCRSQSPNSDCQSRDFELERSHIRRIPSL